MHYNHLLNSQYRSPTVTKLTPPNGFFVPIICCKRKFKNLNIPLPTILISSMKITSSLLSFALIVRKPVSIKCAIFKATVCRYFKCRVKGVPTNIVSCFPSWSYFEYFHLIRIFTWYTIQVPNQCFIQSISNCTFTNTSTTTQKHLDQSIQTTR